MQASTVGGVRVQLHRPTTAQLCIRTPLHPAAVVAAAAAAGTLAPAGEPMLLWQSIALSSPSLPSFSLASPDPSTTLRHFSWRSPLSLSSRVSRPSRPGPRATTESTTSASRGMLCAPRL